MIHTSTLAPQIGSFTPIGKNTLCRRLSDEKMKGGILIPDSAMRTDLQRIEIVSAGPGCELVRPGDQGLMHRQLSHTKIELNGEKLEIVPEEQVLALLEA